MIIKNGKFFKEGIEVPLEHGNKEQIKLLERVNGLLSDGDHPNIREIRKIEVMYRCLCGAIFEISDLELEEDEHLDTLAGNVGRCHNCDLKYILACDECGDLVVKIRPDKSVKEGIGNG
jgi:predicted SprT family Zn-dependent metalloprotease